MDAPVSKSDTDGGLAHGGRGPDYPGDRPSKADREQWVREWPRFLTADQKTVLREGVPAKLKAETAEFDLSTLPALTSGNETAVANREAARAQHVFNNQCKAARKEETLRELSNEIAELLEQSFERRALLTWQDLKKRHAVTGHPDMLNGVAIFKEIKGLEASTLSTKTNDAAKAKLVTLESTVLACDGDAVSEHFNTMLRDVNPYLLEKKSDAVLGRWMIDRMPTSMWNPNPNPNPTPDPNPNPPTAHP